MPRSVYKIAKDGDIKLDPQSDDVFYRGVHVVHMPSQASITLSPEQLQVLEKAQPRLTRISSESLPLATPRMGQVARR